MLAVAAGALLAGYVAPVGPACHGCTSSAASRHAVPLLLDGAETSRRRSRRQLLSSGVGVAATCWALGGMPAPTSASYALYQASYETYTERKATGYVPVATDDSATLQQIQEDILKKRPQSERKAKKPPQYAYRMAHGRMGARAHERMGGSHIAAHCWEEPPGSACLHGPLHVALSSEPTRHPTSAPIQQSTARSPHTRALIAPPRH